MTMAEDPLPLMFDVHPEREVIAQGEPYPDAWVVRYGALLMEVVDPEGHRLALDVLGPGDLVGGPVRLDGGRIGSRARDERALRRPGRSRSATASPGARAVRHGSLARSPGIGSRIASPPGSTISPLDSAVRSREGGVWSCPSRRSTSPD